MITIIPFFLGVFSSKVHKSKLLEPQILVRIVTRSFDLSFNEDKTKNKPLVPHRHCLVHKLCES